MGVNFSQYLVDINIGGVFFIFVQCIGQGFLVVFCQIRIQVGVFQVYIMAIICIFLQYYLQFVYCLLIVCFMASGFVNFCQLFVEVEFGDCGIGFFQQLFSFFIMICFGFQVSQCGDGKRIIWVFCQYLLIGLLGGSGFVVVFVYFVQCQFCLGGGFVIGVVCFYSQLYGFKCVFYLIMDFLQVSYLGVGMYVWLDVDYFVCYSYSGFVLFQFYVGIYECFVNLSIIRVKFYSCFCCF